MVQNQIRGLVVPVGAVVLQVVDRMIIPVHDLITTPLFPSEVVLRSFWTLGETFG